MTELVIVLVAIVILVGIVCVAFGISLNVHAQRIDELKAQLAAKDDDKRAVLQEEHDKQERLANLVKQLKEENAQLSQKLLTSSAPGPALDVVFEAGGGSKR